MAAAAATRRVNAIASLHVEATNGADEESRRSSSSADDSPVAKRINATTSRGPTAPTRRAGAAARQLTTPH
ncbi:unnamed protein product [Miscanthus lutarioriparius]|uniref:Uncharacterized protein n=1 Tax=Miscanthus lutarioriparius TaxID=422564 RepID=A0A811NF48_9POAL|nr:unnamed protein product [Miscanthus lutarioriparius]